ncbi:MAG: hypothetical protein NZ870_03150 [bacterium]|nr:hypothetical protein [bacterium]
MLSLYLDQFKQTIENKKLSNITLLLGTLSYTTGSLLTQAENLGFWLTILVILLAVPFIYSILRIYSYMIKISGYIFTRKKLDLFTNLKHTYITFTPFLSAALISLIIGNWFINLIGFLCTLINFILTIYIIKIKFETGFLKATIILLSIPLAICVFLFFSLITFYFLLK